VTPDQLFLLALKASIILIVFGLGLQARRHDATWLFRHPALYVRSIASMYIVMLTLAFATVSLLDLNPAVKIALIALALSPVPPILPAKQVKAGGKGSYTIGLLVASTASAIVIAPAAIQVIGTVLGRTELHVPPLRIATIVLISVIAPLLAGMLIRAMLPQIAQRIAQPVAKLGAILLVVALLPILIRLWPQLNAVVGNGTLLALALFTLTGLVVGHFLGGPDPDDRTVLSLATSARHPAIAIAIAQVNFPQNRAVMATILWHVLIAAVLSLPYMLWRKRRHAVKQVSTSS
jgi:BASS family bile acid:Na+ symporter